MTSYAVATHVSWLRVLDALGIQSASAGLPACVQCPVCRGRRLTIYEDNTACGAWHYCFDCKRSGDMIELAASVWEVEPAVAAHRLFTEEYPTPDGFTRETADKYAHDLPEFRKKVNDFWAHARGYLVNAKSEEINRLRVKFRVHWNQGLDRWKLGGDRMLGASYRDAVERLFNPYIVIHGGWPKSQRRTFQGPHWKEVLTIAYCDLPEHITGLWFVGRGGRPEDKVYKPVYPFINRRNYEAGLAHLWTVEAAGGNFAGYVLAVDDPMLATRLQLRNFATSNIPLPLVAYHDGSKVCTGAASWRNLGTRRPIFWGLKLTAQMVHQAIISNGLLSLVPANDALQRTVDHYVRDNLATDIMRKAVKRAQPWREALKEWAAHNTDGAVETLLHELSTYRGDVGQVATASPRIRELAGMPAKTTSLKLSKERRVFERGCEWFTVSSNHVEQKVMNATLRIDRAVVENNALLYSGVLVYQGREIPFKQSAHGLEDRTVFRLQKVLAAAVPGAVLLVAPGWQGRLVHLALKLYPPEHG